MYSGRRWIFTSKCLSGLRNKRCECENELFCFDWLIARASRIVAVYLTSGGEWELVLTTKMEVGPLPDFSALKFEVESILDTQLFAEFEAKALRAVKQLSVGASLEDVTSEVATKKRSAHSLLVLMLLEPANYVVLYHLLELKLLEDDEELVPIVAELLLRQSTLTQFLHFVLKTETAKCKDQNTLFRDRGVFVSLYIHLLKMQSCKAWIVGKVLQ